LNVIKHAGGLQGKEMGKKEMGSVDTIKKGKLQKDKRRGTG